MEVGELTLKTLRCLLYYGAELIVALSMTGAMGQIFIKTMT